MILYLVLKILNIKIYGLGVVQILCNTQVLTFETQFIWYLLSSSQSIWASGVLMHYSNAAAVALE